MTRSPSRKSSPDQSIPCCHHIMVKKKQAKSGLGRAIQNAGNKPRTRKQLQEVDPIVFLGNIDFCDASCDSVIQWKWG